MVGFASFPFIVQQSSAENMSPTNNGVSPASKSGGGNSSSASPATDFDAFSSFGKELNSINFESWDEVKKDENSDKNAPSDLMNALEEKKKKRSVDPRTHG